MKIRFVASMSHFAGGTMTYTHRLAHAFLERGHSVRVQSDRVGLTDLGRQPFVLPVWTRDLRYPFQNAVAARRDGGHDVVHVQHEYYLYGSATTAVEFPLLLRLFGWLGRPVVTTLHGVLSRTTVQDSRLLPSLPFGAGATWRLVATIQRRIAQESDAVVVHDPYFREVLIRECGAPPDRVHVIPHGVPTGLTKPARSEARHALQLPPEAAIVLSFGYLARYKGVETLISAFNQLAPLRPELLLVIAGGSPARFAEEGASYRARILGAIAPTVRDRVRFVGFVPEEVVPSWFAAADLVVLTHAVPLAASGVLALAQGFGVGAIAPAIPPFLASISDPSALYPPASPGGLAETLDRATSSPGVIARLARGSAHDAERASWPAVADQHLALYARLMSGRGSTPAR